MTNGNLKPWQIVLFVAAVAALGWSVWNVLGRDRITQADEIVMVDVNTGELFVKDTSRAIVMPAAHPDTGAYSLVPVFRDEDSGELKITSRSAQLLRRIDGDHAAIDTESLVVRAEGEPRRIRRK